MANWKEYTTKTIPEDADEIMIADSKANASKRTPFSGLWNWIAGKLATAVISQLETQNKSIIPALNELNSKKIPFTDADKKSLENIFVEAQKGVSFWGVQNSSDNPRKNIMTVCLNYKAATDWGMQYLFSASLIYYREKRNGTFSDWVQIK